MCANGNERCWREEKRAGEKWFSIFSHRSDKMRLDMNGKWWIYSTLGLFVRCVCLNGVLAALWVQPFIVQQKVKQRAAKRAREREREPEKMNDIRTTTKLHTQQKGRNLFVYAYFFHSISGSRKTKENADKSLHSFNGTCSILRNENFANVHTVHEVILYSNFFFSFFSSRFGLVVACDNTRHAGAYSVHLRSML